jgi:O-antigen/teichoic acid export membrane protein
MFSPTIAELYGKGERQKLDMMFKVVTKWSILLSLPIFEIAVLFAVPLLEISGKEFIPAWPILVVFSVSSILSAATGSVGYILLMTGHQKISAFNSALVVILNVVLGVILTRHYGALGTAFSTGLALAVVNAMRLIEVRILLKMQPYSWSTLKPLAAGFISAVFTGVLLYLFSFMKFSVSLSHKDLPIQLLLVPVFLAMYTGLLILFKISPEDQVVVDRLRKKLGRGKKRKGGKQNNRSQGISAVSGKV